MNIPLSQYQLAHVRKAVFAGIAMVVTAVITAVTNGTSVTAFESWPALGALGIAFLVGFIGTFKIPNKDFMLVEKVIEAINPVLGAKVAVLLDPVLAANEPTDQPRAQQVVLPPLVAPVDPAPALQLQTTPAVAPELRLEDTTTVVPPEGPVPPAGPVE